MAIYDTDKTSDRRTAPIPSSDDKSTSNMALQTISTQYSPIGESQTDRVQMVGKTLLASKNSVNKAAFGYNPALDDWGLFVADDGVDVMTNTDLSKLVFNSSQNTFKIVASGTAISNTYTVSGGSSGVWTNFLAGGPLTIAHNLGYTPSVIAYVKITTTNQYILLPTTTQSIVGNSGTGAAFNRIAVNVDSNNLYILDTTLVNGIVTTSYTAGGLNIKYFLLQETAN